MDRRPDRGYGLHRSSLFAVLIGQSPVRLWFFSGLETGLPNTIRDLDAILKAFDSFDSDPAGFLQTCARAGIKPLVEPLWKNLPYAHIYRSITPDILHQLYQGVIKHLIGWITEACGADEIDVRCRRMPPNHNEHDQMCRILLGLVIDVQLPDGISNVRLRTLSRFHANKDIFVELGIREGFKLPKLHFAKRLHINLAKDAYAATNFKDEFTQMTTWLERKEKILRHNQYVQWQLKGSPPEPQEWLLPGLELDRTLSMAKHPSVRTVPIYWLEHVYGTQFFRTALRRFFALSNEPHLTSAQLERKLCDIRLPFRTLPIWHKIKYLYPDPLTHAPSTADSIHSRPAKKDKRGRLVPGHFDTALINDGTGEDTGIQGYRIARIRVVFSLPERSIPLMFNDEVNVPKHLAYVEWYTAFPNTPDPDHLLYKNFVAESESVCTGTSTVDTISALFNAGEKIRSTPQYMILQPVLRVLLKSHQMAMQSVLHALFLSMAFKVPVQPTQVDAMLEEVPVSKEIGPEAAPSKK
ncbi:hypothetical protein K443DRAFT_12554 [Laccaria amethystina LaAM-08-1]|uniref:Uncharacterized protein n=1 Tax=Laccaria amethystina LaAM-08-1 TaxID=1095629 RepID=A0A0C9WJ09_9AGAR|nr:hypothetical protein K443DRAFT_12554 [Laccaria amethystina LaAM-08-1]